MTTELLFLSLSPDFLHDSAIIAHPRSLCRSLSMNKWGFTGMSYLCSLVKGHKLGGKGLSLKSSWHLTCRIMFLKVTWSNATDLYFTTFSSRYLESTLFLNSELRKIDFNRFSYFSCSTGVYRLTLARKLLAGLPLAEISISESLTPVEDDL